MSENPSGTFDDGRPAHEGDAPTPPPAPPYAPTPPYAPPPLPSDAPAAPGDGTTAGELVPAAYAPPPAPVPEPPYTTAMPYAPPVPKRANGLAIAGFVVGLVSVFLPLLLGLIGGGVGLALSIVGVAKHDDALQSAKGLGIAGIVLSAVAIVFIL